MDEIKTLCLKERYKLCQLFVQEHLTAMPKMFKCQYLELENMTIVDRITYLHY